MNYRILFLVSLLVAAGNLPAHAGQRKLTTYYPSPSGEYKETQVKKTLTIPEKEVGEDIAKVTAGEIWFEKPTT